LNKPGSKGGANFRLFFSSSEYICFSSPSITTNQKQKKETVPVLESPDVVIRLFADANDKPDILSREAFSFPKPELVFLENLLVGDLNEE
jgi:hypothetical protein